MERFFSRQSNHRHQGSPAMPGMPSFSALKHFGGACLLPCAENPAIFTMLACAFVQIS